jgi:hypothetical protein
MLERFKDDIDSVLFGTDSFGREWMPGESLSNVIITPAVCGAGSSAD